ncbi:MAG TPA: hypothetical protein PKK10_04590 [Woeseiaceae bacterium]|nr:hypothetical protein [Woeseiaceae bacterium]
MEYEAKSLQDYIGLIKRRRVILLASIVSISLIGIYIAYAIPPTYQSTSRFLIEQQDIPQDVVQSTISTFVDEQIQAVRTRVMSTSNLSDLIRKYNLYPNLTKAGEMQAAVEELRAKTVLETEVYDVMNPRSGRPMMATISFTLSFDSGNAQTARDVSADLADLFLSENMQSRTGQVQDTLEFIRSSIERYERDVERTGVELAEFKSKNLGNLPELVNYNLQTIERTERQIDALDREIRVSRDQQLELGSQLARLGPSQTVVDGSGNTVVNPTEQLTALQLKKMQLASVYSPEHPDLIQVQKEIDILSRATGLEGNDVATIAAQLAQAKAEYTSNLQRYSPDHPDVIRAGRTVEKLEAELDEASRSARSSPSNPYANDPYAQQLQLRIDTEKKNVATLQQRKQELEQKLADLEATVARSPTVEREYMRLSRANEAAVANLNDAHAKLDSAERAQKLESQGSGDRFTIIEPARVPAEPYKPNRTAISLLAFVLACGVGVVLAMILDTLDDTVKSTRDVLRLIDSPPLAVIPYLETQSEARKRVLANVSMGATVAGAGIVAYLITLFVG